MQRRLLLVEDDARFAEAVSRVLAAAGKGAWLVTRAGTAREALSVVKRRAVDLAIVDLGLPDEPGSRLIARLARGNPAIPAMAFTIFDRRSQVLEAVGAGAVGYLLKDEPLDRVVEQVRECLDGYMPISSRVARFLFEQCRPSQPEVPLTPRELEVLACLQEGHTYAGCAATLGISVGTVQSHVKNLYRKLSVSSRAEAIKWTRQAPP